MSFHTCGSEELLYQGSSEVTEFVWFTNDSDKPVLYKAVAWLRNLAAVAGSDSVSMHLRIEQNGSPTNIALVGITEGSTSVNVASPEFWVDPGSDVTFRLEYDSPSTSYSGTYQAYCKATLL